MTTTGAESFRAFHSPEDSTTRSSSSHSSVAYLFGGLASMVGLIGLAILILACSYWKISGRFEEEEEGEDIGGQILNRIELGEKKNDVTFEEKILVIMAGEQKPTFIATPITSRASSFASHGGSSSITTEDEEKSIDDHVSSEVVVRD